MSEELMHGWEPETPASDSLLREFIEGTAGRGERLAEITGKRATRRDGVAVCDLDSPVWFDNTAVLLQPPSLLDRDAVVAAMAEFFPPDRTFVVMSAFPTWDLRDAGFELMGHPPFMFRPAGGEPPPLPEGLEIRRVDSEREAAVFGQTIEEAYPMPGGAGSPLVRGIGAPELHLFNAYVGDRCVATGGTWNSEGVNDVGWISARAETRRKGIGAAITYASTYAVPTDPAVLIASDDGVGVYERMGYVRLLRLTLWIRPGG